MSLKIGALARRCGMTVRTLHHYDHIGLLRPSARADNGSRLYDQSDVIRLHKIQALKHFGYSLADIQSLLEGTAEPPAAFIERQIDVLDAEVRRATALRDGLLSLRRKLARHESAGIGDWLDILEMMTMYSKQFSTAESADLRWTESGIVDANLAWSSLAGEAAAQMAQALPPASESAQALAWRWMALLDETTRNDAQFAARLRAMQESETRAQQINGITPAMFDWISEAFAHARASLFAKYMNESESAELRRRQVAHVDEWPPLFVEVRAARDAGLAFDDPAVRALAVRWQSLFKASYCGDDAALEAKVRNALSQEPRLMLGIGLDQELMAFIQRAIFALQPRTDAPASLPAGPKPSAAMVAVSRAVHQLLDSPLILNDPLALRILGPEGEADLRAHPERYDDPISKILRTSLVVRSRVAEDEWLAASRGGCRQCVILGAGLDTLAYRTAPPEAASRCFEVDLPSTQAWKRHRLREAGIAEPTWLTYVSTDFRESSLARSLAEAGFDAAQPAFFSWLGVVVYLDEPSIRHTLAFIASCARGSALVFDYVVALEKLSPMERMGVEMVSSRVAAQGEPWKSYFDPDVLADWLREIGFAEADDSDGRRLTDRYLAGRHDGLRLTHSTRVMLARV